MKRFMLILTVALTMSIGAAFNVYAIDYTLYGGFDFSIGLRRMSSTKVEYNGRDYSDEIEVKERNTVLAPGASVMLRIENDKINRASMIKFRYLFLSKMDTELTASTSSARNSASVDITNKYSDFNKAFFIDLCSGRTITMPMGNSGKLLLDIGPSLNFTIAETDNTTERAFGLGLMLNSGFQLNLTKHLRLEPGLSVELNLVFGGRTEPGLGVRSIGFMAPITPYLSLGYKF
jgi:hypothetical protein